MREGVRTEKNKTGKKESKRERESVRLNYSQVSLEEYHSLHGECGNYVNSGESLSMYSSPAYAYTIHMYVCYNKIFFDRCGLT